MGLFSNICGRSKTTANSVAPRTATYRFSLPDSPDVDAAPLQREVDASSEIAALNDSFSKSNRAPTIATVVMAGKATPPQPAHAALAVPQAPTVSAIAPQRVVTQTDVVTPNSPSASTLKMNGVVSPTSASSSAIALPRAVAAKAGSSSSFQDRESELAFGRAPTTVAHPAGDTTLRAQPPTSVKTLTQEGGSGGVAGSLAPRAGITVNSLPSSTVPITAAASAMTPVRAAQAGSTTAMPATTMPAQHTGTLPPPSPSQPAGASVQRTSEIPTARTVPTSATAAASATSSPAASTTTARVSTATVATAKLPQHTPQPPAQVAASAPAPRTNKTATLTCVHSTTRPIRNSIYPTTRHVPAKEKENTFLPLAPVAAHVQATQPSFLNHHHSVSEPSASPSLVATTRTGGGQRASMPALSQVQRTAMVTTEAAPSRATRAASLPATVTTHTTVSASQGSVMPKTAKGPGEKWTSSVKPVPSSSPTSAANQLNTQRPEVEHVGVDQQVSSDPSTRRGSVLEAKESEKGIDPSSVHREAASRSGVITTTRSSVVPKTPRATAAADAAPSTRVTVTPPPAYQQSTALVEVSAIASRAVAQQSPQAEATTISAALAENSFSQTYTHTPSVRSMASQDVWIDAESTTASRTMAGGRVPSVTATPDSRPSTAAFVDGAGPASGAPRGLALANGNTPLQRLARAPTRPGGSPSGVPPLARLPLASTTAPRELLTSMDVCGMSYSTHEGDEAISLTSPPRASMGTRSPSEGSATPIMRVAPQHPPRGAAVSVGPSRASAFIS